MNEQQIRELIKELPDKAFQLLPHYHVYDDKREVIGLVDWSATDPPELMSYEEFDYEFDLYREFEDEEGIKDLARYLERIEKGINLVVDVSKFSEPDWLVEGFIVKKGLTLLYGDSGTGKTTLCLYLADAMQKGKDLFGLKCKQGGVVFVENDESNELLKSHRDKVGLPKRLFVANTDIVWEGEKFNKEFGELLYYYTPDVVVIDAYTSLGIPDITRPESALVLDELRRLAEEHQCAMVIIHHTNRGGDQMGSNLHRAKMDSIVSLTKGSDDTIILTQEKIRGSKFEPKVIHFNQDTLEMRDNKTKMKEVVRAMKSQGMSEEDIIAKFPKSQKDTIKRYLRDPKLLTVDSTQDSK